jgi:hypothetical protein
MTQSSMDSLALSQKLIRALIVLNLVMGFLIILLLVASLVDQDFVMGALGFRPASESSWLFVGARMIMVIGIVSTPLAHVILTRLRAIVDSVPRGPFISINAQRLRTMGWALLGLEVLHIVVGVVAASTSSEAEPIGVSWSFSATRWLAVLLLFVLAHVFEQGAHMREELEGTI